MTTESIVKSGAGKSDGQRQDVVTIQVNGSNVSIHRGHQSVSAIKAAAQVPPADTLVQVIGDKLHPLADGGAVTLKGGEVFVSHPRDCGAS